MEKIIKHISFTGLIFKLFLSITYAQTTDTLKFSSLNDAVAYAIKTNPTLEVYKHQISQANYNLKASESFIFPSVTGAVSAQDNLHLAVTPIPGQLVGKPGTTQYVEFGKKYNYIPSVTLQKDIFNWQNFFQAKVSEGSLKLSEAQQGSYIQSLKQQVGNFYASLLVAQMSLEISKKDKMVADSLDMLAKQRLDEGTSGQITYNQSLINYNNVLQNIAQSQQLYDQAAENLKILFGEKPANELIITQRIDFNELPSLQNIVLGPDKSLLSFNEQLNIALLQAKVQKTVFLPKLSFVAYYGLQQFDNNFGISFNNNSWTRNSYMGLNFSIPVFTGFNTYNKYKSAVEQVNISKIQYNDAINQSTINDRLLLKNYADYTVNTKASQSNFKLYYQTLNLNEQKYKEGIVSLDVYLNAFSDYLKSENTLLNNLSQLLSNQATILSRQ